MQYCDRGPVLFGTLGVGAKPPSVEGLLRSLPRLMGDSTVWLAGRCKSGWVHAQVDSHPFLSSVDPAHVRPWRGLFRDIWRSAMLLVFPCLNVGAMMRAGKLISMGGYVAGPS
jgi:hypothetical protein